MKKKFILPALFFLSFYAFAQENLTTVGIQIKPILPITFFTPAKSVIQDNATFDVTLNSGFSAGMIVRHGFTDLVAVEAGINYIKRKYDLEITDGGFKDNSQFRIIGYEIPTSLLVFIRLGDQLFMNVSMGHSLDMFASSVQSYDDYFIQKSFRKNVFQSAVIANIGWEYRTPKSGYFYLGASYHRPFSYIFISEISYNNRIEPAITTLSGNYITIDLRYFFYQDPRKKGNSSDDQMD
jgi:hypothetical protein